MFSFTKTCTRTYIKILYLFIISSLCIASIPSAYAQKQGPISPTQMPSLAPVLKDVIPSVVNIKATRITPVLENRFSQEQENPSSESLSEPPSNYGLGSGVIIDAKNGYILTNYHVIKDANEIIVTLRNGRHLKAELLGGDPASDIAVLRTSAKDLSAITVGNSDELQVGDYVLAIGNPFGLGQSVTSGIVSALGRTDLGFEGYEDFIQTDASINPGNSGGALVNLRGELVGINTAILSPEKGNVGIGFAIPINMAKTLMYQIIQYGEVRRGLLGVVAQPITEEIADAFHLKDLSGALIAQIIPRSIAEKAGLEVGDIIISVNGKSILNSAELRNVVGLIPIGEKLSVTVIKDGKKKTIPLIMMDPTHYVTFAEEVNPMLSGAEFGDFEGVLPAHGKLKGIQIVRIYPESPADRLGLKVGDVIVSANQQDVETIDELVNASKLRKDLLLLRILRGPSAAYMVIK